MTRQQGLPSSTLWLTKGERAGTCPTCGHALYGSDDNLTRHNPPGCPMRVIRGRYAKDWTEDEWNAERAAHPDENIRPW